jgi:anti-anti-sigma regulatory factor
MTAVSSRHFYIEQVQDVTVVCFTVSSMVEQNYEFVSDELFEIVEYLTSNGPIQVVLDLSSVRRIDDWGLAMLRAFHETIETSGGMTIFCRIPESVASFIDDAGMGKCFETRLTRGDAICIFTLA